MHNTIPLIAVTACIIAALVFGILSDRKRRRANRPGICPQCNENPVEPGAPECFECWAGRLI